MVPFALTARCVIFSAHANLIQTCIFFGEIFSMSLQALIAISRIRDLDRESNVRLEEARRRVQAYDREIEKQIASKAVSRELLAKTCSL